MTRGEKVALAVMITLIVALWTAVFWLGAWTWV